MIDDPLIHIERLTKDTTDYMGARTHGVLRRYPLLFSLLTVFGLVAVLYGFESIIDHITPLADRPWLVSLIGLAILIFTGTLYKRLDRKHLE